MPAKQLPPGWGSQSKNAKPDWSNNNNATVTKIKNSNTAIPYKKINSEEITEPKTEKPAIATEDNNTTPEVITHIDDVLSNTIVPDTKSVTTTSEPQENTVLKSETVTSITSEDLVEPTTENKAKSTAKKAKSKSKIAIIVVIIIIVAAVIATFGYLLFKINGSDANNNSSVSDVAKTTTIVTTPLTTTSKITTKPTGSTTTKVSTQETTAPTNIETTLTTKYYTLAFPTSWKDKYSYNIDKTNDNGYSLSVYHTKTHEQNNGGYFFTVRLISVFDEVPRYLSALYLGDLNTDSAGSFYVYAIFPTDAQFTTSTAKEFQSMHDDIYDILGTLDSHGEAEFIVAKTTGPVVMPLETEDDSHYISDAEDNLRNESNSTPYTVKIDVPFEVSIYEGPGYNYTIVGHLEQPNTYTIVEETSSDNYSNWWGRLKSGKGWINLEDVYYNRYDYYNVYAIITVNDLRLREYPSLNAKIIMKSIPINTRVEIIKTIDEWAYVYCNGNYGWIMTYDNENSYIEYEF